MPRKSEQEWAIIETDYIKNPITYDMLKEKYHISKQALCARFIKRQVEEKRQKCLNQTGLKIQEGVAKDKAKEDFDLIENIREIIKLKSQAEKKLLLQALQEGKDIKILGYSLNKSKDSITELAKLEQLLLGNATDRTEFSDADKDNQARQNRLNLLGFN